ncbi:hypothetical protein DSO57_1009375 [Entomophthora muscae]|uniref:Uncharacterized protein n=2 Tax=Entomophthora muscae TaxID=34485 RepID=A0ACC2SJK7_9FUNG|nr:hypothetical protein DSO57_1009375 [Entomophthora muscae]
MLNLSKSKDLSMGSNFHDPLHYGQRCKDVSSQQERNPDLSSLDSLTDEDKAISDRILDDSFLQTLDTIKARSDLTEGKESYLSHATVKDGYPPLPKEPSSVAPNVSCEEGTLATRYDWFHRQMKMKIFMKWYSLLRGRCQACTNSNAICKVAQAYSKQTSSLDLIFPWESRVPPNGILEALFPIQSMQKELREIPDADFISYTRSTQRTLLYSHGFNLKKEVSIGYRQRLPSLSPLLIQELKALSQLLEAYSLRRRRLTVDLVLRKWHRVYKKCQTWDELGKTRLKRISWKHWENITVHSVTTNKQLALLCTRFVCFFPFKNWYLFCAQVPAYFVELSQQLPLSCRLKPSKDSFKEEQLMLISKYWEIMCSRFHQSTTNKHAPICNDQNANSVLFHTRKLVCPPDVSMVGDTRSEESLELNYLDALMRQYKYCKLIEAPFFIRKRQIFSNSTAEAGIKEEYSSIQFSTIDSLWHSKLVALDRRKEQDEKKKIFNLFSQLKLHKEQADVTQTRHANQIKINAWELWVARAKKSSAKNTPEQLVSRYNNVILNSQPDKPAGRIATLIMESRLQVYHKLLVRRKFQIWRRLTAHSNTAGEKAEAYADLRIISHAFLKWRIQSHLLNTIDD